MAATHLAPADVVAVLDAPAGAYVHVPFCARVCPFCPYDKVVPRPGQPERYFAALRTEVGRYLDAGAGPFTSLYVGGGTPTLFPELLGRTCRRRRRGGAVRARGRRPHRGRRVRRRPRRRVPP